MTSLHQQLLSRLLLFPPFLLLRSGSSFSLPFLVVGVVVGVIVVVAVVVLLFKLLYLAEICTLTSTF